ncbi:hypothetical protein F3Y22_tig00110483pilonHSYRG00019 [Hibiscus syriacus]|uniref:Beta-glucosidase 18 n=1 Tax=Hibiscus syriacus TaxID=106335 RepID=A0A6A3ACR0_HIBSY|nr:hypothetical protein F3Y22_tig00110483pilonHSYRG00019 [Hibiscus syriacus]
MPVEGGYLEDGKGLSNWDVFSHIPEGCRDRSVAWGSVDAGTGGRFGEVNPGGIKFYNKVINNLLLRGIEPFVTVHHFDYPQELGDRYGAWLSPLMQEDFVLLAETCFKSFGDRVKYWATINEPNIYLQKWLVHNMLLAHAKAVKIYREQFQSKQGGSIGIIAQTHMYEPLRNVESDHQAVNRVLAFTGCCIDFIGLNHYSTLYAKDCIHSPCILGGDHFIRGFAYTTGERDGILIGEPTGVERFYVVPRGMEKIVDYISRRYNSMPIYVTENGYSAPLTKAVPDLLHDVNRIKFHKAYLAALARAIRKGANVRGYFLWTLMDNFEWAGGYSSRFGLYYVDRLTMKRTPKLSAKWFQYFLANRSSARINRLRLINGRQKSQHFGKNKRIIIARTEANATDM